MSDKKLRLWDGREYGVASLNASHPELVKYALIHDCLEEIVTSSVIERRRGKKPASFLVMLSVYAALLLVIGGICLASGVPASITWGTVVVVGVVCAVLLLASSASSVGGAVNFPRTLTVQDGVVCVRSFLGVRTFALSECCWFPGKASDDAVYINTLVKVPAVLLVPPVGPVLACGLDQQARDRWHAFLEVAGVRRVLRREGLAGVLLASVQVAISIAIGVGAYRVTDWVTPLLAQFLTPALTHQLPIVAAAVWGWGTLLAIHVLVPGWYRGDHRSQSQIFRSILLFPALVIGRGLASPEIAGSGLAEVASIAVLLGVLLCTLTWIVFRYADRRVARQTLELPHHPK